MIDPPVCVPNATGTMKSATAAADPLDDPPGVCARSRGFAVGPGWRSANSVVTVLPSITRAGLARERDARRICRRPMAGVNRRAVGSRHVVRVDDVLHAERQPVERPARRSPRSRARASASARSGSMWTNACTADSRAAMRSRHARVSASEERRPAAIAATASTASSSFGARTHRKSFFVATQCSEEGLGLACDRPYPMPIIVDYIAVAAVATAI